MEPAQRSGLPAAVLRPEVGVGALSRRAAFDRLSTVNVGRVALTMRALPAVVSVRFYLDKLAVVVASSLWDLRAQAVGQVVAFHADGTDARTGQGWEVCLVGVAAACGDPSPGPDGVGGSVRVPAELVTGSVGTLTGGWSTP